MGTVSHRDDLFRRSTAAHGRGLDKFFKALSDETRRGILRLLERREHTVGEIVGNFHLSQPTISRHLSVLKEARLVDDQRQGQHVVYRLRDDTLADAADQFFGEFRQCRPRSAFETSLTADLTHR